MQVRTHQEHVHNDGRLFMDGGNLVASLSAPATRESTWELRKTAYGETSCLTAPSGEHAALCSCSVERDSKQDVQEFRQGSVPASNEDQIPGCGGRDQKTSRAQSCKHLVSQPCVHSRQRKLCDAMHSNLSENLTF